MDDHDSLRHLNRSVIDAVAKSVNLMDAILAQASGLAMQITTNRRLRRIPDQDRTRQINRYLQQGYERVNHARALLDRLANVEAPSIPEVQREVTRCRWQVQDIADHCLRLANGEPDDYQTEGWTDSCVS